VAATHQPSHTVWKRKEHIILLTKEAIAHHSVTAHVNGVGSRNKTTKAIVDCARFLRRLFLAN
jgi:hypothetical protein